MTHDPNENHAPPAHRAEALAARIRAAASQGVAVLLGIWHERRTSPGDWSAGPDPYREMAHRFLKAAEPLVAYDAATEGLEHWSHDVRLRQLQAMALARSGAAGRASKLFEALVAEGCDDEETLGGLARTYKDAWQEAQDEGRRAECLQEAYTHYLRAYQRTHGYWTGINAATMALLAGEEEQARVLAVRVREQCLGSLAAAQEAGNDTYWELATLGEAALVMGDAPRAADWYAQAASVVAGRWGDLASTRRNARLLLQHLELEAPAIESALALPHVVLFAGHMIDRPGRPEPRFPPEHEGAVKDAIRRELDAMQAQIGYSSAACGADILFLEAMQERGGQTHVVIPYEKAQFIRDSVDFAGSGAWGARCDAVLAASKQVIVASQQRLQERSISYEYANHLLHGLASVRAGHLDTGLSPLAVWSDRPADGPGGTASILAYWLACGHGITVIDPLDPECSRTLAPAADGSVPPEIARYAPRTCTGFSPKSSLSTCVMAMLFADAVGFSRLTEEQIEPFVDRFLGMIGELLAKPEHNPVLRNTWGDGLFFVFPDIRDAGLFALELCERASERDWQAAGLPGHLGLRIALHAGPVYACKDPVTERLNFIGTHVTRAARIEPITPPGCVYASQEFAALAAGRRVPDFACDYVGITALGKGYGTYPMYHVRRRAG